MMMTISKELDFHSIFASFTKERYNEVEQTIGPICEELNEFLREFNGIQFLRSTYFHVHPESNEFTLIDRILGIAPIQFEADLEGEQNARFIRDWGVPEELTVFAEGPYSQLLVSRESRVYLWESQTREPENAEEKADGVKIFLEDMGVSLAQFLRMLQQES